MKLKTKWINFSSGGPLIAILNKEDAIVLDINPLERVRLNYKGKDIVVAVDISFDSKDIKKGEIGLFREIKDSINPKEKETLEISYEKEPESIDLIRKKLDGNELNKLEINTIVKDLLNNSLTEIESTYFVAAGYTRGMTLKEVQYLTEAIINNSEKLKFNNKIVADKHCVGGVPGNRTTMIVVPILAAAGIIIPKTSSKSITSPAGTANTMEVLAPVKFNTDKIKEIVKKTNACMVWGGTGNLASADDKLLKLEKALKLDPEGFLLASILAKKLSAGSNRVLIDIPVGLNSKIETIERAKKLKNHFEKLAKKLKLKIKVVITDGSQPIGNGIGPALEAKDVLLVLENRGPADLKKKSIDLAAELMSLCGIKFSKTKAKKILESGQAMKKMREIIRAQGGNSSIIPEKIKLGKHRAEIKTYTSGRVKSLNNKNLTKIAKMCGAPVNPGSGLYLHAKVGDWIKENKTIITLYSENPERLNDAIEKVKKYALFSIK